MILFSLFSTSDQVDPDNTVPEVNEGNNSAVQEAVFTFPETVVKLYQVIGDQRIEAYTYGAYELMEIEVEHQWENVSLLCTIEDSEGYIYIPRTDGGKIRWSSSHVPPGTYRVKVAIITQVHYDEGTVVERKERAFVIAPTFALEALTLQIDPTFTFVQTADVIRIAAGLRNGSNIAGDLSVHYQFLTPEGGVLGEGVQEFTLTPDQMNLSIEMDPFDYTFIEDGEYTVQLEALYGSVPLGSVSRTFTVLPDIRIEVDKKLDPENIYPTGEGKTKSTIELKGEDATQGP